MYTRVICLVSMALLVCFGLTVEVAGASEIKINFQATGAPIPDGYLPDYSRFRDKIHGIHIARISGIFLHINCK